MDIKVLTVKDLEKILRIGRDKCYALMRSKAFPSIRIGNTYVITEQALNEWLIRNQYKQILV